MTRKTRTGRRLRGPMMGLHEEAREIRTRDGCARGRRRALWGLKKIETEFGWSEGEVQVVMFWGQGSGSDLSQRKRLAGPSMGLFSQIHRHLRSSISISISDVGRYSLAAT